MKIDNVKEAENKAKVEKSKLPLGLLKDQNLPTLFNYTEQVLDKKLTYSEVLEKNPGFNNPSNVEVLTEELGLSNVAGSSSLLNTLQNESEFCQSNFVSAYFQFLLFLGFPNRKRLQPCVKLKLPKWPLNMWRPELNISKMEIQLKPFSA